MNRTPRELSEAPVQRGPRGHKARTLRRSGLYWCAAALIGAWSTVGAQKPQPEIRLDALGPKTASIEPGLGLNFPLGYYVRLGLDAGFNLRSDQGEGVRGNAWRGDILTRFTFDPFRQQRWALSVGGGLSFRRQTYLAAIVDLEGPEVRGVLPALQAGVSGGPRAALILRRAVKGRR